MPDVVMPRLSDSMEEGTILKWLKPDGDEVAKGEELVEIETDKATMTYESDAEGTLEIVAEEGSTLAIGEVIARIGEGAAQPSGQAAEGGEREDAADGDGDGDRSGATTATAARDDAAAATNGADAAPEKAGADERPDADAEAGDEEQVAAAPRAQARAPEAEQAPAPDGNGGRTKASPVARRIAREHGVDLSALQGSGPGGRIVKADVEAAASGGAAPAQAQAGAEAQEAQAPQAREAAPAEAAPEPEAAPERRAAPDGGGTGRGEVTVQEPTRIQQLIARRMAESKATIPHFTLSTEVDMEAAVALRGQLKQLAEDQGTPAPSFNDMVVKASAIALRDFPLANGSYRDGRFELYSRVNIGVAVAADETLVVPTIFDADRKGLGQIATETRALAEKVREGRISPPELSGGTFSITNLGMYGVEHFTAVVNPPQAAILAVGKLGPRAVAHEGEVVVRSRMTLTVSCDHRILYGAPAAEFLARIKAILEQPIALAL
jgi:pyruvate dehydrogenase E2 component (dihydrolipoamide acetyltransferase)